MLLNRIKNTKNEVKFDYFKSIIYNIDCLMAEIRIRKPEKIVVPEMRSLGYRRWVENGAKILRKELPFEGAADLSITIESDASSVLDF